MIDDKKILITGASGFVGSVLLRRIVKDYPKSKVSILLRKSSNTWRLKDILKDVNVLEVDLSDYKKLKNSIQKIKPDVIFHLAAYGAYPSQNCLDNAIKTNILGTSNLLLALDGIDYQIFVNTGSSSEYGYKNHPMKEKDYLEPVSFYAATKASATHICSTYGMLNNKPIITLRLFSIFGPYEEPGRFIPTVILNALKGEEINVVKKAKRDFVYVEDIVDAYLSSLKLKSFKQRIFNICSGNQTSIEKTANEIVKLANSKSKVIVGTYKPRPWDTNYWLGDPKITKTVLKWEPKHKLEEGLLKSIDWFKINRDLYERK